MHREKRQHAFTLIELLIVVAIIAILAAIAVPNFLEAQVRSKVSRAKADMRTIVTGLESYYVDHNHYPRDRNWWGLNGHLECGAPCKNPDLALTRLTTPVSYLSSVPVNPFPNRTDNTADEQSQFRYFGEQWKELILFARAGTPGYPDDTPFIWTLSSIGPNMKSNLGEYLVFGIDTFADKFPNYLPGFNAGPTAVYDPTNGTVSEGDIVFVGPGGPVY